MALECNSAWVAPASGKTIYTCPMHPEVQQDPFTPQNLAPKLSESLINRPLGVNRSVPATHLAAGSWAVQS